MPKKGQVSITLAESIVDIAAEDAREEDRSVANYLKHLILKERRLKEKIAKIKLEDE